MEMENLKDWGYINGTMGQFTKANFKTELGMVVADGNLEDRFIRDNMWMIKDVEKEYINGQEIAIIKENF